jgi:signal transduction histidine kinase
MKFGVKFRLTALGLCAGLAGALIALLILNSERQANALRARLDTIDSESFGIADHFKDSLRNVNNALLRYGLTRDEAEWTQFLKISSALQEWLGKQSPKLGTQYERDALKRAGARYDEYLDVARQLKKQMETSSSQGFTLAQYTELRGATQRVVDQGQALARAHYASRNELVTNASHTLEQLRMSELGLLGLLFVFGVALSVLVYRDMVAPLRVKLVESQALVERREKLASLGLLAAGVAHEIRNPLTAIKAALFIQQKRFQPGTQDYLDAKIVEREILRLERIVSDFLHFARPTEPELATMEAEAPLKEVHQLLVPQLATANIQLSVEAPSQLKIRADAAQIKQVLINLVQNAADSIGRDGSIKLRARPDRKRLDNGETDVVILEVADSGKGMPPEVQKRLFDPFFTTKEDGTGLGLCTAAGIVQKHGGALQYQTQVNRGTTFGIVLPRV